MLKFYFIHGRGLDFTAGTSKSAEIAMLESLKEEKTAAPEGLTAFMTSLLLSDEPHELDEFDE